MTVRELATQLKLEVCCGAAGLDKEIKGGYTSDLLSDVMGNAREGNIWITLQTHKNIMAIASLKELAAIVLVKGYRPEEDTVSESEAEGIPILSTSRQTFEMTGEIYELLQKRAVKDIRADLHIHTVLSPCGDLEMSPENILHFAQTKD